jgi:hypothetical protein
MLVVDMKRALEWLDAHYIYTPEQLAQLRASLQHSPSAQQRTMSKLANLSIRRC